jgi:lactate dehydrogenase-like 2-hydroxyacid dehydrogenase
MGAGPLVKPKVYVTRRFPQAALDLLTVRTDVSAFREDGPIPKEELHRALQDVEGLLVAGARITSEVLEHAPKLRALSNAGVGHDNLDLGALTARGIPVTSTAGSLEETTADLAFALLLAVARRVVEGDRYVREGRWDRWQFDLLHGSDVHAKTLGLYGFGHIGQGMARRGRGFSMRILYHARHRAPETVERGLEAEYVDRERLLGESDFLSLHIPLTPETHHVIGAAELSRMKRSAFLINTARGKVVDEEALAAALRDKKIAGAGLDVFENEPRVHPVLPSLPNVVMMPHVGSATGETRLRMAMLAAQNLLDLLEGRRPKNLLNPEVFKQHGGTTGLDC